MKNIRGIIVGILFIVLFIFMFIQTGSINDLKSDISLKQSLKEELENKLDEQDVQVEAEQHVEEVKEGVVSAKEIGEEMIEVDNILTAFYKSWDPLPEDEQIFQDLEKAQQKNTELTGAGEHDHIATWQLNPEWTLTLETVVNYGNVEQIPVLFTMRTTEGDFAGIVRATYDVNEYQLRDISVKYTPTGEKERVL